MTSEVERFIRIQSPSGRDWRTLPNGNRVRVWEMGSVDAVAEGAADETGARQFFFHIGYVDGVVRGCG